jgi:AcrR family transcriptional regulator
VDPRQQKTRARLAEAVLALATECPISEVTVSELAAKAGVHRSTFYEHAASPIDLLQSVLRDELDEIRGHYLVGSTPEQAAAVITSTTERVLRHIDKHDAIYRRGLGEGSGSASLQPLLSSHFRGSIDLLFSQGSVALPPRLDRDTASAYIADGTVGAIEVWLRAPSPRDLGAFLAQIARSAPAWWPIGD